MECANQQWYRLVYTERDYGAHSTVRDGPERTGEDFHQRALASRPIATRSGSKARKWRSGRRATPSSWSQWRSANGRPATGSVLTGARRISIWVASFPQAGGSSISPRTTCDLAARYQCPDSRGTRPPAGRARPPPGLEARTTSPSPALPLPNRGTAPRRAPTPSGNGRRGQPCWRLSRLSRSIATRRSTTHAFDTSCAVNRSGNVIC